MSRKDEILEAVISKFQEEGFSYDLKLSEIAQLVNIGKSTIYEYFKSKDDVFKEALLKITSNNIDEVINIKNIANLSFEDAFKAQFSKMLEVASKSRMMFEVFSKDFSHQFTKESQEELMNKMQEIKKIIEQRFTLVMIKGFEEGKISLKPSPINEMIISSLIVGGMLRYSGSENKIVLSDFVNEVFDTIIKIAN